MEPLRNVDLNLLVVLDALLDEANVTRAGARLGLSAPATSHALARLRDTLDDPLLVRAGRSMVLTPRAESLRPEVSRCLAQARRVFTPADEVDLRSVRRTFRVHATDHILTVLGTALDRLVSSEAPGVQLEFMPNRLEDAELLRTGNADLALGVYPEISSEHRRSDLFGDRFVCVVRADHPTVRQKPSLRRFTELDHVLVAPRGRPGSLVDRVLAERGLSRRVARTVPYFLHAALLVSKTDYVLTVSERLARTVEEPFALRVVGHPLPLPAYTLHQLWHARLDEDPIHRWLREAVERAAREAAPTMRG